jgi:hypothetical protein
MGLKASSITVPYGDLSNNIAFSWIFEKSSLFLRKNPAYTLFQSKHNTNPERWIIHRPPVAASNAAECQFVASTPLLRGSCRQQSPPF